MNLTVATIANMAGGEVEGEGSASIRGFAKIEEAAPGDLTFIANPKYAHFIHTTQATAVLVGRDFDPAGAHGAALIRVDDPYAALAGLLSALAPKPHTPDGVEEGAHVAPGVEVPEGCYIGAFAYVAPGVKLGSGVKVYPHCYIGAGVRIGSGSVLRSGVKVYEGCEIGERCTLHSGVVVGADGFGFAPSPEGYEKIPQIGNVVIEDDVEIGANTTVDRATFGSTRIGRGTKLDNLVMVAHNVEVGRHNVMAAQTGIAGSTKIGDWNRVGGQTGFAGHIKVGDRNEFGAQSGVPHSVGNDKRLIGYPVVDIRTFARNCVYMGKLGDLFGDVARIERRLQEKK